MRKTGKTQRLLACFGEPSRFRVVTALLAGERCVSDLAGMVGLSQSCTTRHLQALVREGLVTGKREGKRVMFRVCLEEPRIAEIVQWAASAHRRSLDRGRTPGAAGRAASRGPADGRDGPPLSDGVHATPPAFDVEGSGADESEGVATSDVESSGAHEPDDTATPDAETEPETPSRVPRRGDIEDFLL